jgi:hypothetical protein
LKKWAIKVAVSQQMGADPQKSNYREHHDRINHLGRRVVSLAYMAKCDATNTFDEKPNCGDYN